MSDLQNQNLIGVLSAFLKGGGLEAVQAVVTNFYDELLQLKDFQTLGMNAVELVGVQTEQICAALAKVVETKDPEAIGEFSRVNFL